MSDLTGNFFLHNSRGKLAGAVLGVRKGRTIMRENVKPSNPQTYAQMVRRVKWGNLVNVHRILAQAGLMANAWEGKRSKWTDYNALMSANPCDETNENWLEKEECAKGEIKAKTPIVVAHGTLFTASSVYVAGNEKAFQTEIKINSEAQDISTYGELSAIILAENPDLIPGDELTFVVISQNISDEGKLTQTVKLETFTLDVNNSDEWDDDSITAYNVDATRLMYGTYQALTGKKTEFGAYYISRKTDTGVKVSHSTMTYGGYVNPGSLSDAIESYSGEEAAAFLDPTN